MGKFGNALLSPSLRLMARDSYGMNAPELRELMRVAEENMELIERFWNEHFSF